MAGGGFLGVEAFFVLSGFLITSLLVAEWRRTHTIALGAFWARRARRLLPALFLMVAVVGLYYAVAGPMDAVPDLKGAGLSTLLYTGNWHQISTGTSYFAASGPVSPLKHTWSLAIEEQFYLFWPVLLVGVFWRSAAGSPGAIATAAAPYGRAGADDSRCAGVGDRHRDPLQRRQGPGPRLLRHDTRAASP